MPDLTDILRSADTAKLSDAEAAAKCNEPILHRKPSRPDDSLVAALIEAKVLTAEQVEPVVYDKTYPAGTPDVTEEDVKAARQLIVRQDVVAGYRATVMAYLNDVLNVADVNPDSPLMPPEKYFAGGANVETLSLVR